MDTFSDALLSFARGYLGGAIEQYSAFQEQVPSGRMRMEHATGTAWIGDRALRRSGELGTFAEDLTFMWAWAKPDLAGLPGVEHAHRLREIGVQQGILEFAEGLLDFGGFPDPKLAADHLSLIALGVLRARGSMKFNHGGRAYAYLVTDDEEITCAATDPARVGEYLRIAALLLPGDGTRDVLTGYARWHGLTTRPTPDGMELMLPGGHRLIARIDLRDNIIEASMVDPEGASYAPEAAVRQQAQRVAPFVPDGLLAELAPAVAITMGLKGGLLDFAEGLRELERPTSIWDPAQGRFGVAELPELSIAAAEIGRYDRAAQRWDWAENDWAGSQAVRHLAREHGADHLAAAAVDLTRIAPHGENAIDVLSAAAVQLGGAVGWAFVPDGAGYRILALTDERITAPGTDPDLACAVFDAAANLLHPLTDPENRYRTMRELVVGYFRRYGIPTIYVGEPQLLMGHFGLYEVRVEFGVDGAVSRTGFGMIGGALTMNP
ncbi:DUF6882 domain-containing protein [Nocardia sp. XZ_19_385]|uniref:DUF6882 domain-containing protein n=1 Tax=Nocardia sp. XZ_19_385 TaxID=2769488 RepID=UPI00188F6B4C|nr:DUF6882 domain-containing protein [Nocardia sp. XZ_19_385]